MVPGGTAGYFAVQTTGLALSQGIWSSIKVLVAFFWGILVFHEPVKSIAVTVVAILLLMAGLLGVSLHASRTQEEGGSTSDSDDGSLLEPLILDSEVGWTGSPRTHCTGAACSFSGVQRRHLGILGAVFDGAYGGSILVPMHFASPEMRGLSYVGSFAIGCLVVVCCVWMLRYLICCIQTKSFLDGFYALPSFHLSTVGPNAALSGLIWSVGNISSILSVALLGQGVGYSIVQSQLLVAGLWGVFWFREVRGTAAILRWMLFAFVTVAGIVMLSLEHRKDVIHL